MTQLTFVNSNNHFIIQEFDALHNLIALVDLVKIHYKEAYTITNLVKIHQKDAYFITKIRLDVLILVVHGDSNMASLERAGNFRFYHFIYASFSKD